MQALEQLPRAEKPTLSLSALAPVLTSVRDSERVDLVEDRLVYLNEATVLLQQLVERLEWSAVEIERTLLSGISARLLGMLRAEVEGLKGQARPVVTLKTQRIVPRGEAEIALEIINQGRAPAENIVVTVLPDPAYALVDPPAAIPFLPAGRTRQITFTISPRVEDRFRLVCNVSYADRMQNDKTIAFGDMVYLLTPEREFKRIRNPYAPGTPLRRNSHVFFGREDVFEFIAETAGRRDQQNVLILVGQRRTGKTSTLLRLGQHLPEHLVPVYIDCQSLGVVYRHRCLFP